MKPSPCTWIGPNDERCETNAVESRSYCEDHLWICYQKGTKLGTRKKDQRICDDVHLWESMIDEIAKEMESEGYTF